MKKFYRIFVYIIGILSLSLGIVLTTKARLGVSPIISVPYGISAIWHVNLGLVTAIVYIIFVLGEIIISGKNFCPVQILQIPLSILFGIAINMFCSVIMIQSNNFAVNLLIIIFSILFTGLGAALMLLMDIIPNAADGFVQAISIRTGKKLGFVKNIFDACSVTVTIAIGIVFAGKIVGIGLGTVLAVIGVGRVITLVNLTLRKKLTALVY